MSELNIIIVSTTTVITITTITIITTTIIIIITTTIIIIVITTIIIIIINSQTISWKRQASNELPCFPENKSVSLASQSYGRGVYYGGHLLYVLGYHLTMSEEIENIKFKITKALLCINCKLTQRVDTHMTSFDV